MKKLVVPKFATEAEEARWWDAQAPAVEANLIEAMRNGTGRRGTAVRLSREARSSENVALPSADFERAQKLSRRKKIDCREYILGLLHDALDREEAAQKRSRRKSA